MYGTCTCILVHIHGMFMVYTCDMYATYTEHTRFCHALPDLNSYHESKPMLLTRCSHSTELLLYYCHGCLVKYNRPLMTTTIDIMNEAKFGRIRT